MKPLVIDIQSLSFTYPKSTKPLINNLSLTVEEGSVFGLFGPNGAGKTTLISILTGLLKFKNGTITVLGEDLSKNKKLIQSQIGFVPQSLSLYEELSPIQNLKYFGAMQGMEEEVLVNRTKEVLEVLGLSQVANNAIKTFSGGMKRRVNLGIGVLHSPSLLFLDEPTVGVDVQSRNAIIDFLKLIQSKGTSLFYTSHHLMEAEELCDKIALIDQGEIIVEGELSTLLNERNEQSLESLFLSLTGRAYRD